MISGTIADMKIPVQDLYMTMRRRIASSPYTYDDLERMSGVSKRYIQRFKNAEIDELNATQTLKLCKALGIRANFSIRD